MGNFNRLESDGDLLALLEEGSFLTTEVQEDIIGSMDIEEINDTITDVCKILERRKKKLSGTEEFLSTDDKEILDSFLEELHETVTSLIDDVRNTTTLVLEDLFE